jgi:uncharacterized membrane protein YfhO
VSFALRLFPPQFEEFTHLLLILFKSSYVGVCFSGFHPPDVFLKKLLRLFCLANQEAYVASFTRETSFCLVCVARALVWRSAL